jgi:hypothetical protein
MKKYKFLWTVIAMLSGLIVNGQVNKSIKADPVAQLKKLIEIPKIEMVSIKWFPSLYCHRDHLPSDTILNRSSKRLK